MKPLYIILLLFCNNLINGCTLNNDRLEKRLKEYSDKTGCVKEPCIFKMTQITWFDWDNMHLHEDEEGLHCIFKKNDKIVYSYLKPITFDVPRDIEFGFADLQLKSDYTFNDCTFSLKVEQKDDLWNSEVYFILPANAK